MAAGDLVNVRGMSVQGVVESIDERGEEAEVSVGNVLLRSPWNDSRMRRSRNLAASPGPRWGWTWGPCSEPWSSI